MLPIKHLRVGCLVACAWQMKKVLRPVWGGLNMVSCGHLQTFTNMCRKHMAHPHCCLSSRVHMVTAWWLECLPITTSQVTLGRHSFHLCIFNCKVVTLTVPTRRSSEGEGEPCIYIQSPLMPLCCGNYLIYFLGHFWSFSVLLLW